ncbi:hypothetical protein V1477_003568 [Vespula maculifrons]|uniref:Uncharacterized protein n=1 Tax=Vespula maculifrons TaxID=7453 RepID=A0ABD2CT34_VESMC
MQLCDCQWNKSLSPSIRISNLLVSTPIMIVTEMVTRIIEAHNTVTRIRDSEELNFINRINEMKLIKSK